MEEGDRIQGKREEERRRKIESPGVFSHDTNPKGSGFHSLALIASFLQIQPQ